LQFNSLPFKCKQTSIGVISTKHQRVERTSGWPVRLTPSLIKPNPTVIPIFAIGKRGICPLLRNQSMLVAPHYLAANQTPLGVISPLLVCHSAHAGTRMRRVCSQNVLLNICATSHSFPSCQSKPYHSANRTIGRVGQTVCDSISRRTSGRPARLTLPSIKPILNCYSDFCHR